MLLRRITEHVKSQNWTAVGLDFIIVVVGVFIGIQVANWNDARAERDAETVLLERFHVDVQTAQSRLAGFAKLRRERFENLRTVSDLFYGVEVLCPLTDEECNSVSDTHIMSFPPANVPTLTEIFAGGQIGLIRSERIKSAILRLEQANDRARTVFAGLNMNAVELAHIHSELFSLSVEPDPLHEDGLERVAICHHQEMIESKAFLNDFASSINRNNGYLFIMIEPLVKALDALHDELDAYLLTSHTEGAS